MAQGKNFELEAVAPEECGPRDLDIDDARALAEQLARDALPYARLVTCRRGPKVSVVVFDADVEVPQDPVHDIRNLERVGVVFATGDTKAPEVLALREDFPGTVAHLNLRPWTFPKSLCLYDVSFRDVRAQWTPARFVARVREWLRLTARGELHGTDQPLEPLLGDWAGWVILPRALRADATDTASGGPVATPLRIERLPDHRGKYVLVASALEEPLPARAVEGASGVVATSVRIDPRPFAAMRRAPSTLAELHEMLAEGGDDLVAVLRTRLGDLGRTKAVLDAMFVLVVLVPVKRSAQGAVENVEAWAFITDTRIGALGVALGLWELKAGVPGFLLPPDTRRSGENVRVELLSPVFTLSREDAARQNGRAGPNEMPITAIGGGTLGSQLLLNSVRAAFGRWTVIDDDLLLPHNLARHALPATATGLSKASSLAIFASELTHESSVCNGIVADVLEAGDAAEAVAVALEKAEVIVDISASVAVARALARDVVSLARRVSVYLNPSGTDLAVLAEDVDRAVPLDVLEMQYYRALIQREELHGSLLEPATRIRYGRSCRDVSVQLPAALAALHGGIAARALEQTLASSAPRLRVWRVEEASLSVTSIDITPAPARICAIGDWTLITDDSLLQRLAALRIAKLPNETGGVLVGAFDLKRRIVYVVDTVPSPPDSREWPMLYIRGCVGLEAEVRQIEAATAGQLHYIGEWHSHPEGHACSPSGDDAKVFAWLTEKMDDDGLPGLMMIVGDDGLAVPYLGCMVRDGSYPATLKPSPHAAA